MLKKCDSLQQAEKVIDLVLADNRAKDLDGVIEAYQNCREQGYMVWNYENAAYIAECKNSDAIMVYFGSYANQGLSEDAWKNAKGFNHDDYQGAANYIYECFYL